MYKIKIESKLKRELTEREKTNIENFEKNVFKGLLICGLSDDNLSFSTLIGDYSITDMAKILYSTKKTINWLHDNIFKLIHIIEEENYEKSIKLRIIIDKILRGELSDTEELISDLDKIESNDNT